jgi:hypothetical protein
MGVETRGGAAAPSGQAARVASVEELTEGARMARLAMGCYRNFESVAKEEGLFCVAEGTSHRGFEPEDASHMRETARMFGPRSRMNRVVVPSWGFPGSTTSLWAK